MIATWRCGMCETVNHGGRACSACGADLSRRSRVLTETRARLTPPAAPPPPSAPLPVVVERAINREPVAEEEWEDYEAESFDMLPIPGGCLFSFGPRKSSW